MKNALEMIDSEGILLVAVYPGHPEGAAEGEELCRFTADVYDAYEMLPWLRTFIGRVVELKCSNPAVVKTFYEELAQLQAMYGGDADAVQ